MTHKNQITILVVLLSGLLIGCQEGRQQAVKVACDQSCNVEIPKIVFSETDHDFGKIAAGSKQSCAFDFMNDGGKDLVIKSVYASCGCTTTAAENTTLQPGQASEIEVIYRAPFYGGKFKKRITVYTNDPQHPQIILWISSEVYGSSNSTQAASLYPKATPQSAIHPHKEATMSKELKQTLRNLNKATD